MVVRRRSCVGAVLGVFALVIAALALTPSLPEADAGPSPDGNYYQGTNWLYGPFASSDPSHTAYSGSSLPLEHFSGMDIPIGVREDERLGSEDQMAGGSLLKREVSVSGINGASAVVSFDGIRINCDEPDFMGEYCTVPTRSYSVTLSWTFRGYAADCYYEWKFDTSGKPLDCPLQEFKGQATRKVVGGKPGATTTTVPTAPTADFVARQNAADRFEYDFESTSHDDVDAPAELTYSWKFGDGATSAEMSPTHRYEHAGTYDVTLEVTDSGGQKSTKTARVVVAAGLVVNSTGDGAATDPEVMGCNTGQKVGDEPECTLRAAIETANANGGGEITFDIDGAGVPSIAPAAELPVITSATTIDGTTQPGGWVEVHGSGAHVIQVQGGPSVVTGLVVRGGSGYQVEVLGGSGQVVRGNRIGTNDAGTASDTASKQGVGVRAGTGARIEDNVVGASEIGIALYAASSGATVEGNTVGVAGDGSTSLGDIKASIVVSGPDATITRNVTRGRTVGIEILGATASNAKVSDNAVGVSRDGTAALMSEGYGIRSDGAPGVTITGNRVGSGVAAVAVGGSNQTTNSEEGLLLLPPEIDPEAKPVTGAKATVTDNELGLLANGTGLEGANGIVVWAGMTEATLSGNRVGATSSTAIRLLGGARHSVVGNTIGGDSDATGPPPVPVHDAIEVSGATDVTIGGLGDDFNTVVHTDGGVDATDAGTGLRIEGNRIAAATKDSDGTGIQIGEKSDGVVVTANRVVGGSTGISSEAPNAQLTGNRAMGQSEVGIAGEGDKTTISGSVVLALKDGIRVKGDDVAVSANRIGLDEGSEDIIGNGGVGLTVQGGKASVSKNLIAGTGAQGIDVSGGTATLRSNRVWATGGDAIHVVGGPDVPKLAAAARSGSGADTRTTLLLTDLPKDDAGTIEVFANGDCAKPEAEFLMDINRKKSKTETARVIVMKGASTRDHFTVTYTNEDGRTSPLSNCADAGTYPDSDGDGSIDPFDATFGRAGDPGSGVYATDNEKLMMASVSPKDPATGEGGGRLERLEFVNDPAPDGHPSGWSMPYGVMRFRISGLAPGGRTGVSLAILDASDPFPAGVGYWKYGPQSAGGDPSWWNFSFDEATGTGAVVSDGVNLPLVGLTRVVGLRFVDGGRGDSDGGANGTITDPGGPVFVSQAPTDPPVTDTTPDGSSPPSAAAPSAAAPSAAAPSGSVPAVVESASGSTPGATTAGSGAPSSGLSHTGITPAPLVALGALLLVAGGIVVEVDRRRRRRRADHVV